MNFVEEMKAKASEYQNSLVLPEGNEERTIEAASLIMAEKLAKSANILNVEAQSVIALDYDMQRALTEKMEAMTGKKVILSNKISSLLHNLK